MPAWEKGEIAENGNYLEPVGIAVRHGICGDPEQHEEEGANFYSTPNEDWPILETYRKGQVVELKMGVVAHRVSLFCPPVPGRASGLPLLFFIRGEWVLRFRAGMGQGQQQQRE